jgi:itaconate CoA-transferase
LLEALIARGRTGKGARIQISMFDVMADWLTVPLLNAEAGKTPRRMGLAHPSISPYGVFSARDGRQILISIQSEREWAKLCKDLLGNADFAADPRFCSNVERVNNRALTDGLVAAAFARRDRDAGRNPRRRRHSFRRTQRHGGAVASSTSAPDRSRDRGGHHRLSSAGGDRRR